MRGLLPSAQGLPRADWERRHRWICALLALHAGALPVAAFATGASAVHAAAHIGPILACLLVAEARRASLRTRSLGAALGLLISAASVVHLAPDSTEAHFHFFVAIVVLGLYEDWAVLALALVFVPAHHLGIGGSAAWTLLHSAYLGAAVVASAVAWRLNHDVRERARVSERHFRGAFDNAPIGVALVGLDGRFLQVNDALCRMLGRSRDDLLAASFHAVTHPDDLQVGVALMHEVLDGTRESYRLDKRYLHSSGHVVWALLNVSLVRRDDGTPQHFISQILDITQRREAEERLRYLADHDELTGLLGRRRFLDELDLAAALADRHGQEGSVLLLDLDEFKAVNDTLGHDAGDALLRAVAATLRGRVRRSDLVARLGGDEFAVLLPRTGIEEARHLAVGLAAAIRALRLSHSGRDITTAASIGVTPVTSAGAQQLLVQADVAMYEAKAAGRDTVRVLAPGAVAGT